MIYLGFEIDWPRKYVSPKDYIEKTWKLGKNKCLEIQLSRGGNILLGASLNFAPYGRDHAGMMVEVSFLRHFFIINFYDSRHWDYENNCWEKYE